MLLILCLFVQFVGEYEKQFLITPTSQVAVVPSIFFLGKVAELQRSEVALSFLCMVHCEIRACQAYLCLQVQLFFGCVNINTVSCLHQWNSSVMLASIELRFCLQALQDMQKCVSTWFHAYTNRTVQKYLHLLSCNGSQCLEDMQKCV